MVELSKATKAEEGTGRVFRLYRPWGHRNATFLQYKFEEKLKLVLTYIGMGSAVLAAGRSAVPVGDFLRSFGCALL